MQLFILSFVRQTKVDDVAREYELRAQAAKNDLENFKKNIEEKLREEVESKKRAKMEAAEERKRRLRENLKMMEEQMNKEAEEEERREVEKQEKIKRLQVKNMVREYLHFFFTGPSHLQTLSCILFVYYQVDTGRRRVNPGQFRQQICKHSNGLRSFMIIQQLSGPLLPPTKDPTPVL